MKTSERLVDYLLQSKSIIIDHANPFQWASGWQSPIYCDNRRTLSHPEIRRFIRDSFIGLLKEKYEPPYIIAGVATGAIAHAALVAGELDLPMVYVRPEPKSHGRKNIIEGDISQGTDVVIIEDLVSTGGSSLKAAEALREAGCRVLGMLAVFTYGFTQAEEKFKNAGISLHALADYTALLDRAVETNYVNASELEILEDWRLNPETWSPAR